MDPGTPFLSRPPLESPLVGRERELAMLRASLEKVVAGEGSLILVSGEAGIGKTTLVEWFAGEARAKQACVLKGYCYDFTLTPPYGLWSDAFASNPLGQEPDLSQSLHPDPGSSPTTDQSSLFEQVRRYLAGLAAHQPVVFILEDLHWSDPASLDLLRYLAPGVDSLACLLIATYRTDELNRNHPLAQRLPSLVRGARVQRAELRRLSEDDVSALVRNNYTLASEDQARLVTYLYTRTEGNPFYLLEVLRTLESERFLRPDAERHLVGNLEQAPVPALVRQVIEGRLNHFDDDERQLLELAAVIGQVVPLDVWARASGVDVDTLADLAERAVEAHVFSALRGNSHITFTHALVQETLYDGQLLTSRQRRHREISETLSEMPDSPVSTVAWHFAQADDPRGVDWLIRAGEQAIARYAAQDGAQMLRRAEDLALRFSRDLPLTAYWNRAKAYETTGAFEFARRDYERVLHQVRQEGDRAAEWQVLLDLGMLWMARDYERTGEYYTAALTLARSIGDKSIVARSLNRVGNWQCNLNRLDTAISLHKEALELFEKSADQEGIAETLDFLGIASYLNSDTSSSVSFYERAISLLRELDDRARLSSSLALISLNGGATTAPAMAPVYRGANYWVRCCQEALEITRDIGLPSGESFTLALLSGLHGLRGDFGQALHDAQSAVSIAERLGHREWVAFSRGTLGRVWDELLDPRAAQVELELALDAARMSGSRLHLTRVASSLASVLIDTGNLARASDVLESVAQPDVEGTSSTQRQSRFVRAKLALARNELNEALDIIEYLIETRPSPSNEDRLPYLMKIRGDVFTRMGDLPDAEASYLNAQEGAALFEFRSLLWRVEIALGELYRRQNRHQDAEQAFQNAHDLIEVHASSIPDTAIREHFESSALAHLPRSLRVEHDSTVNELLSRRETEVLRLIVEGRSDREIADTLSISPRTVMRHVSSILTKLDVPSRTAAATLAIRNDLV